MVDKDDDNDSDKDHYGYDYQVEDTSLASQYSSKTTNLFEKYIHLEEETAEQSKYKEQTFQVEFDSTKHISGPYRAENGTVPMNILEFQYSFAYDCRKLFNLCVADPNTIIFASGNFIHFFNVVDDVMWFRRGSTGGGIGHIVKNPIFNHITIGENGTDPPITIYEWPYMKIVTVLIGGAAKCYSRLAYSPDGLLLVSQSGHPDYLITVWNWQERKIVLRCKSYGQDVCNVMFSQSVPGHLTSCGSGHIKFWKMANTFTGLKLKGELGKFGKTEICDVIGVYPMPDEKVVSSCEWGNILLWEEGLIKVEVCRKNKQTCHGKSIAQFEYLNGELVSVGMDGWIRMWFYETIDQADPPDDNRFLEIQPIYEFHVAENTRTGRESSMLMCMQKQDPDDPEETFWYAQDGNGGLWIIDLATFSSPQPPRKIFTCHAGPIIDMSTADWGPFVATFGSDGRLHVYNYMKKILIIVHKFNDMGTQVTWFPCKIEPTGSTLMCAFQSGIIRMITVSTLTADKAKYKEGDYVRLIKAMKPHNMPITVMSLNLSCSLLVTCSKDATVFVFGVNRTETYPDIVPIGYIRVPSYVTCCGWKPEEDTTLLTGCFEGDCVEVKLPEVPQSYTTISYELVHTKCSAFKFHSVKSAIRREMVRAENQRLKAQKVQRKLEQIERLKAANPGIEIDEDLFLLDSEEDLVLPEIYIPEIPSQVLFVQYTAQQTIWLSMSGFDAGYMYEYPCPGTHEFLPDEPVRSTIICDAEDTEIRSFAFYNNRKYIFLGMEHGEIRVCRLKETDHTDLSDYWILAVHDNYNGFIPKILLSYDSKMLLTCGHDGNLFSFAINDDSPHEEYNVPPMKDPLPLPEYNAEDIEDHDYPSIEEVIVKAEHNRIVSTAKEKKEKTLQELHKLTEEYGKIMERNRNLLKSQQIPRQVFELDPRITADLNDQLAAEANLVHSKLAFKVEKSKLALQKLMDHFIEPITGLPFAVCRILKPDTMVHSLREQKLDSTFIETYSDVIRRLEERERIGRIKDESVNEEAAEEEEAQRVEGAESFLNYLNKSTVEYRLGVQINQMLRKYRARKARLQERGREWKAMYAKKPDPSTLHPADVAAIENAKKTIGDYKLKSSAVFSSKVDKHDTTLSKYKQLLDSRKKLHRIREDFNNKLKEVRRKKQSLQTEVMQLVQSLKRIHAEIPQKKIKPLPIIPVIDVNIEYPEKNLELEKYTSMAERVKEAKRQRRSLSIDPAYDPTDEEYEVLLLDKKMVYIDETDSGSMIIPSSDIKIRAQSSVQVDMLQTLCTSDRVETAWEHEMKRSRMIRKIYEQDCILRYVQRSYEELDKELDDMEFERLNIVAESVYLELFILTLHQEFIVLREFEAMENALVEKVNKGLTECASIKQNILSTNVKIDQRNKEIAKLHEKMKDVTTEYMSLIRDYKFFAFLCRIYRKRYKPPKEEDESLSSSTSESSSDDNGTATTDSREIEAIHFDESICPAGCDRELYDAAFTMREKRYDYEYQIKEEQKVVEALKKENDGHARRLKLAEGILKSKEDELAKFMLEKQERLNDIDVTVILKFHQLQHITSTDAMEKLQNCIVFDKTNLSNLYTRIGELQQDTLNLHSKHKKNRTHLRRMKIDCKYMEAEIKRLKDEIKEEMIKKFGQEVSLTTLYETVLRRMIYQVKANLNEMTKTVDQQIKCVKGNFSKEMVVLENLIQDNTEKLSFLTVLEEEQLKLRKTLMQGTVTEEEIARVESRYNHDLIKLESILKKQEEQKQMFRNDIKNLSMKSRSLPPVCPKKADSEKHAMIENENDEVTEIAYDKNGNQNPDTKVTVKKIVEFPDEEEHEDENQTKIDYLLMSFVQASLKEESAEEAVHDMLRELISDLFKDCSIDRITTIIKNSFDRVSNQLPECNEETMKFIRELLIQALNNITARVKFDETNYDIVTEEPQSIITKLLEELLCNIGVTSTKELRDEIIEQLSTEDGENNALKYITENILPEADRDEATLEDIAESLSEIRIQLKSTT